MEGRGGGWNFSDHIKREMLGRRWATSIIRGSGRSWEDLGSPCPRSSPTLSEKQMSNHRTISTLVASDSLCVLLRLFLNHMSLLLAGVPCGIVMGILHWQGLVGLPPHLQTWKKAGGTLGEGQRLPQVLNWATWTRFRVYLFKKSICLG